MFAPTTIRLSRSQKDGRQRSASQHHHVLYRLGLGIVGGEFAEGAILPNEADLLARFNVSRTILREALKTLAAKGMIVARARVGTRVLERRHWNYFDPDVLSWHAESGVDQAFLTSLAEMRLAFEPEAAALACERRSDDQLRQLFACIDAMGAAKSAGGDFVAADLRFHLAVAEASGNPMMRSLSALIEIALEVTFAVSSPIPNTAAHATTVARHRAVADAIRVGDATAARSAMQDVVLEGLRRVQAAGGGPAASRNQAMAETS